MTPVEFEQALATYYRTLGFDVQTTPISGDYGIDLFATQRSQKIGIQAKMYGNGRKVNREMIMQLHGAGCYFDCTSTVMATNGTVLTDAQAVAKKLGMEIFYFDPEVLSAKPAVITSKQTPSLSDTCQPTPTRDIQKHFDDIWQNHIMPLQGTVLCRDNGKTNTIVKVDWTGIVRISSNAKKSTLPIEIFRFTIEHLMLHGSITRKQINDQYAKRGSSGILLILEQVPLFERTAKPLMLTYKK